MSTAPSLQAGSLLARSLAFAAEAYMLARRQRMKALGLASMQSLPHLAATTYQHSSLLHGLQASDLARLVRLARLIGDADAANHPHLHAILLTAILSFGPALVRTHTFYTPC